jgi:hypothetical protein
MALLDGIIGTTRDVATGMRTFGSQPVYFIIRCINFSLPVAPSTPAAQSSKWFTARANLSRQPELQKPTTRPTALTPTTIDLSTTGTAIVTVRLVIQDTAPGFDGEIQFWLNNRIAATLYLMTAEVRLGLLYDSGKGLCQQLYSHELLDHRLGTVMTDVPRYKRA